MTVSTTMMEPTTAATASTTTSRRERDVVLSPSNTEQTPKKPSLSTIDNASTRELTNMLRSSLQELTDAPFTEMDVWKLATFLQEAMSASNRNYHCMDHVLHVARGGDELSRLAGLFHDVIYTIETAKDDDNDDTCCLTRAQAELLQDVSTPKATPSWTPSADDDATLRNAIMALFEIQPQDIRSSQKTPSGWNEFLSALVAARLLRPFLSLEQIVQIVVCVEATIPFRHVRMMEDLYQRLVRVVHEYDIKLSPQHCVQAMHRATALANRDVDNFAYRNPALFLDKTWMLLPEMNVALQHTTSSRYYSCWDYREAILKMQRFFTRFLDPTTVFHGFRGKHLVAEETRQAAWNVEIAKRYLSAKLTSATIMCALSVLATGDVHAPLVKLVGPNWRHVLASQYSSRRPEGLDDYDAVVYDILSKGRVAQVDFDIKESPLAAWLFCQVRGDDGIQTLLQSVESTSEFTTATARTLLQRVPRPVTDVVVNHVLTNVSDTWRKNLSREISTLQTSSYSSST